MFDVTYALVPSLPEVTSRGPANVHIISPLAAAYDVLAQAPFSNSLSLPHPWPPGICFQTIVPSTKLRWLMVCVWCVLWRLVIEFAINDLAQPLAAVWYVPFDHVGCQSCWDVIIALAFKWNCVCTTIHISPADHIDLQTKSYGLDLSVNNDGSVFQKHTVFVFNTDVFCFLFFLAVRVTICRQ